MFHAGGRSGGGWETCLEVILRASSIGGHCLENNYRLLPIHVEETERHPTLYLFSGYCLSPPSNHQVLYSMANEPISIAYTFLGRLYYTTVRLHALLPFQKWWIPVRSTSYVLAACYEQHTRDTAQGSFIHSFIHTRLPT